MAIIYPSRNFLVGDQTISGKLTASSGVSIPSSSAYQIGDKAVLQQNQVAVSLFNNFFVAGITGSTQIVSGSNTEAFLALGSTKLYPYNLTVGNSYFAKGRWTVIQGETLGINIESSGSEGNGGISIDSWGNNESVYITSHAGKNIVSSSQGTEISGDLSIFGGFSTQLSKKTSSFTASSGDNVILVSASSGQINVNLPLAADYPNKRYIVKKIDNSNNAVNIQSRVVEFNTSGTYSETKILSGSFAVDSVDNFGTSVAVNSSGDICVVGAQRDETGSSTNAGLAYVFYKQNNNWQQIKVLTGSYATGSDFFGIDVDITSNGNKIIVGAQEDETGSLTSAGLAYVFNSGAAGWYEEAIISGSYAVDQDDYFGASVTINSSGNRIIVGAIADETASTNNNGLVYIFDSGSNGWSETTYLTGAAAAFNYFGYSVSIDATGNRAVIGAPQQNSNQGRAYIIDSGSSGWSITKHLSGTYATNSLDFFGTKVHINSSGNRVFVGANADEITASAVDVGLVYIFDSGSGGWSETTVLSGSFSGSSPDDFGISLSSNDAGDVLVVGAKSDETGSSVTATGLAYLYQSSSANGWILKQIFSGSSATLVSDNFGTSVAVDSLGATVIIGAAGDDAPFTGDASGLVYVFSASYNAINDKIDEISSSISLINHNDKIELISDGTGSWYTI